MNIIKLKKKGNQRNQREPDYLQLLQLLLSSLGTNHKRDVILKF